MTGDQADILARLKSVLPAGWFQGPTPILDGVLSGVASLGAWAYSLIAYVRLQTRISTATDAWLDIISLDFFGTSMLRLRGEIDAAFRIRLLANILLPRVTRQAMVDLLTRLTGYAPIITELWRPLDTGAWSRIGGWGVYGAWTSLTAAAYTAYITIIRKIQGLPYRGGWSTPGMAWGNNAGMACWAALTDFPGYVPDQTLFDAINSVRAFGTTVFANFQMTVSSPHGVIPPPPPAPTAAYVGAWGRTSPRNFALFGWGIPSAGAWR